MVIVVSLFMNSHGIRDNNDDDNDCHHRSCHHHRQSPLIAIKPVVQSDYHYSKADDRNDTNLSNNSNTKLS